MSVTYSSHSTGTDLWTFSSFPASSQLIQWGMITQEVESNVCICLVAMQCLLVFALLVLANIAYAPHYLYIKSAISFACKC